MRWQAGKLWSNRDFLKLWGGETISLIGSQVTLLALPLTAVQILKATPTQVGLLRTLELAPFLFISMFAGMWIDRGRRRPVLIVTNVGRAILLSLIPLLLVMRQLHIEYLYAIALFIGSFTVFFELAYRSFLPTLVQPEHLIEGNSKLFSSESFSEISGQGLAGVLVQLITAPFAILVDVASFLVSAFSLMLIRTPEPVPTLHKHKQSLRHEISEGFRVTFSNRYLRAFAGEAATYNLFWQMIQTLLVLYAIRELQISPIALGLIISIGSCGALLGALLTGPIARRWGIGATILATMVLSDIAPIFIPLATRPALNAMLLLSLAFFVCGVGTTACNIHVISIRQAITPNRIQGRVNASYRLIVSGTLAVGAFLGGLLGEWIGLRTTLLIAALGLLSPWLWIVFSPVRKLRSLPTGTNESLTENAEHLVSTSIASED